VDVPVPGPDERETEKVLAEFIYLGKEMEGGRKDEIPFLEYGRWELSGELIRL